MACAHLFKVSADITEAETDVFVVDFKVRCTLCSAHILFSDTSALHPICAGMRLSAVGDLEYLPQSPPPRKGASLRIVK